MLRLSTNGNLRFVQSNNFDINYGGGEANVCVSLANYKNDAYFVSLLPDNELGQSAINSLKQHNVNTEYIKRKGDRIGIYFLETGVSMRPSKVIYDRANSSIANCDINDFDFDEIFKDCDLFHFTGITPALGDNVSEVVLKALISAKKNNVLVSVDLNYRKKLWSVQKAIKTMTPLMQYVDIAIGNEEDFEKCLGFKPNNSDIEKGVLSIDGYKKMFLEIKNKFNFKIIATSLRQSYSASDNAWSGLIYDSKENVFNLSKKYDIRLVDRVGGGDSFSAGLIHGLLKYKNSKDAIEFAVAASALKQTIFGDFNLSTEEEVLNLINGDSSGRVQR